ncbi:PAS domain S-box protein [Pseudoflavonifractor sp. BIOML-A14]|nr:PAS domain S-box protein [Pseudoflavonifractor sp. BIOML-A14]
MMETLKGLNAWDVLNNINDGVVIVDSGGKTLWVNTAWDRITGLNRLDVLGKRMADVVGEGFYDRSVTEAVLQSRSITTIPQSSKTGKSLVSTGIPVFTGEDPREIQYIVICMRDITELKDAEHRLKLASEQNEQFLRQLEEFRKQSAPGHIVAESKAMRDVLELAGRIARVDSTGLITGESGVGKGLLARYIHDCSPGRRGGPFVPINCGAIPAPLLESELFGYETGAFTGAKRGGKAGLYETAHQGTLFLDEIGEFPLELQPKLLHVLQDGAVTRVGGTAAHRYDVRIVAATNRDLEALVAAGRFRADLYYRLAVVPIQIPGLRRRQEDIIPLAAFYLDRYNRRYGLRRQLTAPLLDRMTAYPWPGNVRELSNAIERMVVTAETDFLTAGQFDFKLHAGDDAAPASPVPNPGDGRPLRVRLAEVEAEIIARAIRDHGTQAKAAQALGISLSTLIRRQRHGRPV